MEREKERGRRSSTSLEEPDELKHVELSQGK